MDQDSIWDAYAESVEEGLYDGLGRDVTYEEVAAACTKEGFDDYCQGLEELYHDRHNS